jgi:hypothetical protein
VIIIIAVLASPGPDISGRYELLVAGRRTDTVIDIKTTDSNFEIQFLENDVVRSRYVLPKPRGGRFTIENTVDGRTGDRFHLQIVNDGLKGTADIATLARDIDVFFRKVR